MGRNETGPQDGPRKDPRRSASSSGRRSSCPAPAPTSTSSWRRPAAWRTSWRSGELLVYDALKRDESCGAHFREEHQTPDGEALRDDEQFAYVAAWEFKGEGKAPILHKEPLDFENVHLAQRSYK